VWRAKEDVGIAARDGMASGLKAPMPDEDGDGPSPADTDTPTPTPSLAVLTTETASAHAFSHRRRQYKVGSSARPRQSAVYRPFAASGHDGVIE
jgi:hypothetical protein